MQGTRLRSEAIHTTLPARRAVLTEDGNESCTGHSPVGQHQSPMRQPSTLQTPKKILHQDQRYVAKKRVTVWHGVCIGSELNMDMT